MGRESQSRKWHANALRIVMAGWASLIITMSALGQPAFPSRVITLVVPFAAGGGADTIARLVAQKAGETLGQTVIVENRAGAGGAIANRAVISAEADGHVVLFGTAGTQAVAPALNPGIGFDPRDDLVPVTRIGVTPNLLVVHPSLPAKTVAELIALAKAQPGQLAYASSGTGTVSHLSAALFARMAGIDLNHIPYRGAGPANNDLLAGQVKMMFDSPISLLPLVNADKLRVLAVTSAGRLPFLPAIPTLAESGFPGYLSEIWLGVFAPKGTPQPVVAKLHAAFAAAVGAPEVQARMMQLGFAPNLGDGPALGAILRQDFERWSAVIKATGIPAQ